MSDVHADAVEVHGDCDERFRALADVFEASVRSGADRGASIALAVEGELVVDMWGGWAEHHAPVPWERDTIVAVFSSSKIVVAISVLLAWDSGALDIDAPIATYWPEFGRNGKDTITARQVLVHRSGLPGVGRPYDDLLDDFDAVLRLIEDAPLWYEPGSECVYHPMTFGYILAGLVERVTGVPYRGFVHRELTGPLGADFHFGVSDPAIVARVAQLRMEGEREPLPTERAERILSEVTPIIDPRVPRDLAALCPSGGGVTNARALVKIGSVMAMRGTVGGRRYLRPETVDEAVREQSFAVDDIFGPLRLGLGFGLDSEGFRAVTDTAFHWGGYGGSFLVMDTTSRISCAYTPNMLRLPKMSAEASEVEQGERFDAYWNAVSEIARSLS